MSEKHKDIEGLAICGQKNGKIHILHMHIKINIHLYINIKYRTWLIIAGNIVVNIGNNIASYIASHLVSNMAGKIILNNTK